MVSSCSTRSARRRSLALLGVCIGSVGWSSSALAAPFVGIVDSGGVATGCIFSDLKTAFLAANDGDSVVVQAGVHAVPAETFDVSSFSSGFTWTLAGGDGSCDVVASGLTPTTLMPDATVSADPLVTMVGDPSLAHAVTVKNLVFDGQDAGSVTTAQALVLDGMDASLGRLTMDGTLGPAVHGVDSALVLDGEAVDISIDTDTSTTPVAIALDGTSLVSGVGSSLTLSTKGTAAGGDGVLALDAPEIGLADVEVDGYARGILSLTLLTSGGPVSVEDGVFTLSASVAGAGVSVSTGGKVRVTDTEVSGFGTGLNLQSNDIHIDESTIFDNGRGVFLSCGVGFTWSCDAPVMVVENTRVHHNVGGGGLVVAQTGSNTGVLPGVWDVTLDGVEVDHNTSTADGGGLTIGGADEVDAPDLYDVTLGCGTAIHDNTAAGDGGGILVEPNFDGDARVWTNGANPASTDPCVVVSGNAAARGGGAHVGGLGNGDAKLGLTDARLFDNTSSTANTGAAIHVAGHGVLSLANTVVYDNAASTPSLNGQVAAIGMTGTKTSALLRGATIVDNDALGVVTTVVGTFLGIEDSIVLKNGPTGMGNFWAAPGAGASITCTNAVDFGGSVLPGTGNVGVAPVFQPGAGNYRLAAGTPAAMIDACPVWLTPLAVDADGVDRAVDPVTMGAFEP